MQGDGSLAIAQTGSIPTFRSAIDEFDSLNCVRHFCRGRIVDLLVWFCVLCQLEVVYPDVVKEYFVRVILRNHV